LIAADRLDVSDAVVAATKLQQPVEKSPASVTGWRVWGESAAHITEET
jgi:hypothetical protein